MFLIFSSIFVVFIKNLFYFDIHYKYSPNKNTRTFSTFRVKIIIIFKIKTMIYSVKLTFTIRDFRCIYLK